MKSPKLTPSIVSSKAMKKPVTAKNSEATKNADTSKS
jgi:hypothetical protein